MSWWWQGEWCYSVVLQEDVPARRITVSIRLPHHHTTTTAASSSSPDSSSSRLDRALVARLCLSLNALLEEVR